MLNEYVGMNIVINIKTMMKQYQIELSVNRLVLHQTLLQEHRFRVTLVDITKEVEMDSDLFQTEELIIPARSVAVDLSSLPSFKFKASSKT